MPRVSDAMTRAGQSSIPDTTGTDVGEPLPADGAVEMWPAEEPATTPAFSPAVDRHEAHFPDEGLHASPASSMAAAALSGTLVQEKLVTGEATDAVPVEQYRRLAARLHLSQSERGTRIVMITSAVASEGKTLTATNLALTLSESYKRRVLLIDADLRRPWVHELFRVPNVTGLNDGIRADSDRKVPLIRVSEYLSVLTAGRPDPDPMSVLVSDRMRRVLNDAGRSFDWVIVDTPPVAVLSDAHLLASLVDTVVLVVKAGSTQMVSMKRAVEAVGRDRILGVVLNCADEGRQPAYNYYEYASRAGKAATS